MKVTCISCFNNYDNRMKYVIDFFKNRGDYIEYIYADFDHIKKKYNESVLPNSYMIHVPTYTKNISISRLYSHAIFSRKIGRHLEKTEPNVIYCMIPPNTLVREVSRYKKTHPKCRVIFDMYDGWPESFLVQKNSMFLKFPFYIWREMRDGNLDKADLLMSVSKEGCGFLNEYINERNKSIPIRLVYPFINETLSPHFTFDIADSISFCYLGNVNTITDTDLLVEVLSIVRKKKKVDIHFVGAGENLDILAERLMKFGVTVVKHGLCFDDQEKTEIFAKCDMGINVPRKEVHSTMSLKSVEYLRAGLPFINSGDGDNYEMVRDENIGINVERKSILHAADRISTLTNDELLQMHKNCINTYKERFLNQNFKDILAPVLMEEDN